MQKNNYYLQYSNGNAVLPEKVYFTGNEVINTAYYKQYWESCRAIVSEIIPALENFTSINLLLPRDNDKSNMLLEYAKLLNMTNINFLSPETICKVKELKELQIDIAHRKHSVVNLRWLLKYRGLRTLKYGIKKLLLLYDNGVFIPEEILIFLKNHNFMIVRNQDINISHTVNLIAGAEQIITTHSDGITNCIFCNSDCKILDISDNDNLSNEVFINNITTLSSKTKLFYEKIKNDELHLFAEKFEQFFTT